MLKILSLLLGGGREKSPFREITESVRELIKGKEVDPQTAIELVHELNKAEAKHRSIFVAGWRPFIGWICGLAFATHYIIIPIISTYTDFAVPEFDTNSLFTVLMGMLGLGTLRTVEKHNGKA